MANEYNLAQTGNLSPEDFAQQQQLNRQQQMAQMLLQQSQQPQGQMISGRYVAPSWAQQLAPLANIAASQYIGGKADTEAAKLAQQIRQNKSTANQAVLDKFLGTPDQVTEMAGPYTGNVPMPVATKEGAKPDYAGALREINSPTNYYGAGKDLLPSIMEQLSPKQTPEQIRYKAALADGSFKGGFNAFLNQMSDKDKASLAIDKQRLGLEGARFGLEQQKVLQELAGGKLTEGQALSVGFGTRAKQANDIAKDLETKGIAIPGKTSTVVSGIAGMTPFVGEKYAEATKSLFNVLPESVGGLSPEQQQNQQARRNFVSAVLRKESGAAISPQEFINEEKKYFPQLGDSDKVIKQKQEARDLAIKALEIQAGPGARLIKEAGAPKKVVNFNDLP